jgi:ribonuclease HI
MSVPAPHFLLYSEVGSGAARESCTAARALSESSRLSREGQWRFVIRLPGGETSFEAADEEHEASAERLELLAIIRGLEALDQPSRVTLVTASRNVQRGLDCGLPQWREDEWEWERFGEMKPVKNRDLWQRLDRLLGIHEVECRVKRPAAADDLAAPRLAARGVRRLRIDQATVKSEALNPKHETNSKFKGRNVPNQSGVGHLNLVHSCLFRISEFVFRALSFGKRDVLQG